MGAGNSLKVASSMPLAKELPNPLQGICPLAINNNNNNNVDRGMDWHDPRRVDVILRSPTSALESAWSETERRLGLIRVRVL